MNYHSNNSTRKNSVNSSLATIKLPSSINEVNQTINKQKQRIKIRFSHQETLQPHEKLQRNSSYKENFNSYNVTQTSLYFCMNHPNKQASHVILQNTQNPMYYCERCAILIASKGFNINQLQILEDKENILQKKNRSLSSKSLFFNNQIGGDKNKKVFKNIKNQSFQNPTKKDKKHTQTKIYLNKKTITQLQNHWTKTKQNRQQSISQIDICINYLNDNIDKLQDYFYTLHEYIQKQKNNQIKQILYKKQSLQNLRIQINNYFIKQFNSIKNLKQEFVKFKEYNYQKYRNVINEKKYQQVKIDSQAILSGFYERDLYSSENVHYLGKEILRIIHGFHHSQQQKLEENKNYYDFIGQNYDYKQDTLKTFALMHNKQQHKRFSFKNIQLNNNKLINNKPKQHDSSNTINYQNQQFFRNRPSIQKKNQNRTYNEQKNTQNIQSSVRSLQLSFASSQNDQKCENNYKKQESNNFTLNQYINRGQQCSSYATNLLQTSTEI